MTASLKGLLAVNKPTGITSVVALRCLQRIFKTSPILADTFAAAKRLREAEIQSKAKGHKQRKRRKGRMEIKIGHGGTLDPLASGVLVTGIGDGTKHLQQLTACTKAYEAVALFGCATDSYDTAGKVVKWAPYRHVTKAAVEEALKAFRGDIIQRPPLYSVLRSDRKRLYKYAYQGKELPHRLKARPVTCELLELVDFTTNHSWDFPKQEAEEEEKVICATLQKRAAGTGDKHAREEVTGDVEPVANKKKTLEQEEVEINPEEMLAGDSESNLEAASEASEEPRPAAITLRMTVSSRFFARSLIHDLGEALGSAAHVVKLVRTRQGQFEIGKNVVEWTDLQSENTLNAWNEEQKMLD